MNGLLFLLVTQALYPEPTGVWQSTDRAHAVVVTKQEWGWRVEWWWTKTKEMNYIGALRRDGLFSFTEWGNATEHPCNMYGGSWRIYGAGPRLFCYGYEFWRLQ